MSIHSLLRHVGMEVPEVITVGGREVHDDLKPLPAWRQRLAQFRAWWKRSRYQRQKRYRTLGIAVQKLLTLAISVLGATLISYGAYLIYAPLGYITGGMLAWLLLWSHEQDRRRSG